MAREQIEVVEKKLQKYVKNIKKIVDDVQDYTSKKNILIVLSRELIDLSLEAKNIYFDAKKSKNELEFEQSKQLLINCFKAQNVVYGQLVTLVETTEPMLAFKFDGVIMSNNNYIKRISEEKIPQNTKYY